MNAQTFPFVILCVDPRCPNALRNHNELYLGLDPEMFTVLETYPGLDGQLSQPLYSWDFDFSTIVKAIEVKLKRILPLLNPPAIIISGHTECKGNTVDDATHILQIKQSVRNFVELSRLWNIEIPEIHGTFHHKKKNSEKFVSQLLILAKKENLEWQFLEDEPMFDYINKKYLFKNAKMA